MMKMTSMRAMTSVRKMSFTPASMLVGACRRSSAASTPSGNRSREAFHRGLDLAAHGHGVAARLLVNDDHGRRVALVGRAYAVGLAAERHLGDVAQADLFARGGGPHDDVGELLGGGDLRRHGHRIGVGHAVGRRLGAELPGRVDAALLLDGGRRPRRAVMP